MRICFYLVMILLLSGTSSLALENIQMTVSPKIGNTFGEIQCMLKKDYYPNFNLGLKYQRLYSLNSYMAGIEASLSKKSENFTDLALDLGIQRNLNNPTDSMVNSEFLNNILPYYDYTRIHEAKYYGEIQHWIINLSCKKRLTRPHKICLYLWNGLRYRYVEQNLFRPPPDNKEPEIYYEYKALSPYLGLIFNFTPRERMVVDFSAAYMLTYVSEYYKHYYISQHTEFDDYGHGLMTSVKMKVRLRNKFLYIITSTGIESEFIYARTSTKLDLIGFWNNKNTFIEDINNVTTLIQFSLYLSVGIDL